MKPYLLITLLLLFSTTSCNIFKQEKTPPVPTDLQLTHLKGKVKKVSCVEYERHGNLIETTNIRSTYTRFYDEDGFLIKDTSAGYICSFSTTNRSYSYPLSVKQKEIIRINKGTYDQSIDSVINIYKDDSTYLSKHYNRRTDIDKEDTSKLIQQEWISTYSDTNGNIIKQIIVDLGHHGHKRDTFIQEYKYDSKNSLIETASTSTYTYGHPDKTYYKTIESDTVGNPTLVYQDGLAFFLESAIYYTYEYYD